MDPFAATRLGVGLAGLAVAAASDLRLRKVSDPLWIVLGSLGLVLLVADLLVTSADLARYAATASGAFLFYAIFFGAPLFEEDRFHFRPARIGVFGLALALFLAAALRAPGLAPAEAAATMELLTMPAMVVVYQVFYQVGLLHGGADAKGLIALTLLVPTYPDTSPFPWIVLDPRVAPTLRVLFPFSLGVLTNAAILFLGLPLGYLLYNAARGDLRVPMAFFGYRADLRKLPEHVWPMERIDDRGEHVLVLFPRRGRDSAKDLERLREAGIERVWVQPKVPFMVPLLGGFVLAIFAGNLLLGLMQAILPRS